MLEILCWIAVFNGIFGIPIMYFLDKKAHKESLMDFYRLMHSTNFDLNYDVLQKIKESDEQTQKLFINFRLDQHDKFKRQLEEIEALHKTDKQNEILLKIEELKRYYESEEETRNL